MNKLYLNLGDVMRPTFNRIREMDFLKLGADRDATLD
jgi:hypothetical protein